MTATVNKCKTCIFYRNKCIFLDKKASYGLDSNNETVIVNCTGFQTEESMMGIPTCCRETFNSQQKIIDKQTEDIKEWEEASEDDEHLIQLLNGVIKRLKVDNKELRDAFIEEGIHGLKSCPHTESCINRYKGSKDEHLSSWF